MRAGTSSSSRGPLTDAADVLASNSRVLTQVRQVHQYYHSALKGDYAAHEGGVLQVRDTNLWDELLT